MKIQKMSRIAQLHLKFVPSSSTQILVTLNDAPPSSLMDSTMSPKVKTVEGEGVEQQNKTKLRVP
jgi:hypothetical protein